MADGASSSLLICSTVYAATVTGICVGTLAGWMATIGDESIGGKKYFEGSAIAAELISTVGVEVGGANVVEDIYAALELLMGRAVVSDGVVNNDIGRYVVTGGVIVDDGGIYSGDANRPSIGSEL